MAEIVVKLVNGELAGKTAQTIAKEANQAALALKKAEVGTKEWVAASQKLEQTKKLQADLKSQIDATKNSSDQLKAAWNKLPGAQLFNQIGQSFGLLKNGVGGLVSQFGVLKTAIASTGIGLLVLAISSLISYFTTMQEGMDKVTSVTRPLKAIFDSLIGVLQNLGGSVFKQLSAAIQNPIQSLKDLGQILLDNVINRFKAFALIGPAINKLFKGDLSGGFKDLADAGLQAVTGIENVIDKVANAGNALINLVDEAYEKGKRLDELQKQIERGEINQIRRSKEIELGIKQQKDLVEDSTKSWDARRDAAERALILQQTGLRLELDLLDKRIAKMRIEQSLNDTSREQEKELAELEAKKLELQARATEQGIEFKKKINELDKAQSTEQLAIVRNTEDLRLQVLKDGVDKEIAQTQLDTERKIEQLKGNAEQILEQKILLEEIEAQTIQGIKDKYEADRITKNREYLNQLNSDSEKWADDQIRLDQDRADFAQSMDNVRIDSTRSLNDFLAESLAKQLGDENAAKKIKKAAGLVDIVLNLIKEKSANAALAATNPLNSVTFGAAGAAQLIGLNQASNIRAAISAARVISLERGGMIRGPRHSGGGVPIEAEGGEFMFSREAVQAIGANRLSALNTYYTRKFADGGGVPMPSSPFVDRPPIRNSNNIGSSLDPMMNAIENLGDRITQLSEATDRRIDRIQVNNNLQETQKGLKTLQQLKSEADV